MPKVNHLRLALCLTALFLPLAGCQTGPAVTVFDGYYTGETENITDGVGNCPPNQTSTPMRVSGADVTYGDFRGRITNMGSLQMDSWQNTLTGTFKNTVSGQFSGNRFEGRLNLRQPPPSGLVCTYKLGLSR